jgi:hypothetical protein
MSAKLGVTSHSTGQSSEAAAASLFALHGDFAALCATLSCARPLITEGRSWDREHRLLTVNHRAQRATTSPPRRQDWHAR